MSAPTDFHSDLSQLEDAGEFIARHIGVTPDDERKMLAVIGEPSRQSLIDSIVPRLYLSARLLNDLARE